MILVRQFLFAVCLGVVASTGTAQNQNHPGLVSLGGGDWGSVEEAQAKGLIHYQGRWLDPKLKKKLAKWEKADAKGLEWENAYRSDTKNYRVTTNVPRFIVELEIKPFLDELYNTYVEVFKRDFGLKGKAAKNRWIKIYHGFEDYTAHEASESGRATTRMNPGFIAGGDELVVFYEETDPAQFYGTVFHEGAHQFFHSMLPGADLPTWISEGLATYFEGCTYSRATQQITAGFLPPTRLMLARGILAKERGEKEGLAGRLFMNHTQAQFGGEEYALAWSFIYYLVNRPTKNPQKKFAAFLQELNGSGTKPIEAVFKKAAKEELAEVEKGWRDFVLGLGTAEAPHWVILGATDAGAGEDLRDGDKVWSVNGAEIYGLGGFGAAWEARPTDRAFEVTVVRCTPGPMDPQASHSFVTVSIEPGSKLTLRAASSVTRSSALSD